MKELNQKYFKLALLFCLLFTLAKNSFADDHIASHRYLADPATLVYNGRVYLYASNDDDNSDDKDSGYKMKSIVCISSSDMKNWTDHGVVFEAPRDVTWANRTWAPSVIARNGKIYLYFGNGGSGIGVATASSPTGPFKDALGKKLIDNETPGVQPAKNMWLFDPMAFLDDDGQAYLYFGGNGEDNMRVIKLNKDMISVNGQATSFHVPSFFEASWMHKRNGNYYFSYSSNPKAQMRIDYMMSKSPTTGFTYKGVIGAQPPNNNNNNHHGIFEFKGKWYHAYHNRVVAIKKGIPPVYKRNLAIEELNYNADGTIAQVIYTENGVTQIGAVNPYERNQAEMLQDQNGVATKKNDVGGMLVTGLKNNAWIKIQGVDFGKKGPKSFSARLSGLSSGSSLEVHIGSITGKQIAKMASSEKDESGLQTLSVKTGEVKGKVDVYLLVTSPNPSASLDMDWWSFQQR
ncbi:glycoside hydrolase family 43 protein [Pedobacter sp. WC2501]|uniref:glycoside hydrolase family 43 protein n=1 Tax=Pedobacter sp. WC2501 TaxID=3461400 RepID=UPI004045B296